MKREWWIDFRDTSKYSGLKFVTDVFVDPLLCNQEIIHVIEFSAYEKVIGVLTRISKAPCDAPDFPSCSCVACIATTTLRELNK